MADILPFPCARGATRLPPPGDPACVPPTKRVYRARGLTRTYRSGESEVFALRGVDLDVLPGEFVVLLGPSGSGKSTLLNLLGGLDSPSSGELVWRDLDLAHASEAERTLYRRQHVGFVFQFYNLIASLDARENVELVTDLVEASITAADALERVGLAHRQHHFLAAIRRRAATGRDRPRNRQAPGRPALRRTHGRARLPHRQAGARGDRTGKPRNRYDHAGHHSQRSDRGHGRPSAATGRRADHRGSA